MTAGVYRGGTFTFLLDVPQTYPFHAPQVRCLNRTWHPNIDPRNGAVHLPIVRGDWRPVLNINTVVYGLQLLFAEPNVDSACNSLAARALLENPAVFEEQVRLTLAGGTFFGVQFEANQGATRSLMKRKSSSLDALLDLDSMRLDDNASDMDVNVVAFEEGGEVGPSTDEEAETLYFSRSKRTCSLQDRKFAMAAYAVPAKKAELRLGMNGENDYVECSSSSNRSWGGDGSTSSSSSCEADYMNPEVPHLNSNGGGGGALVATPCSPAIGCLPLPPMHSQGHTFVATPKCSTPTTRVPKFSVRPEASFSGGTQAWQPTQRNFHPMLHQPLAQQQFSGISPSQMRQLQPEQQCLQQHQVILQHCSIQQECQALFSENVLPSSNNSAGLCDVSHEPVAKTFSPSVDAMAV